MLKEDNNKTNTTQNLTTNTQKQRLKTKCLPKHTNIYLKKIITQTHIRIHKHSNQHSNLPTQSKNTQYFPNTSTNNLKACQHKNNDHITQRKSNQRYISKLLTRYQPQLPSSPTHKYEVYFKKRTHKQTNTLSYPKAHRNNPSNSTNTSPSKQKTCQNKHKDHIEHTFRKIYTNKTLKHKKANKTDKVHTLNPQPQLSSSPTHKYDVYSTLRERVTITAKIPIITSSKSKHTNNRLQSFRTKILTKTNLNTNQNIINPTQTHNHKNHNNPTYKQILNTNLKHPSSKYLHTQRRNRDINTTQRKVKRTNTNKINTQTTNTSLIKRSTNQIKRMHAKTYRYKKHKPHTNSHKLRRLLKPNTHETKNKRKQNKSNPLYEILLSHKHNKSLYTNTLHHNNNSVTQPLNINTIYLRHLLLQNSYTHTSGKRKVPNTLNSTQNKIKQNHLESI